MSGSLKPQDTLAAIGRLLAEIDRRLRTIETLPSGGDDSTHPGTGTDSTQVGDGADAATDYSTALGVNASGTGGIGNTAVGYASHADSGYGNTSTGYSSVADSGNYNTALGADATARAEKATAVGGSSSASGDRSVALGYDCDVTTDDAGKIKVDSFEVEPSSGASASSLILHDSAGGRWKVTVDTTGHLTTTAL